MTRGFLRRRTAANEEVRPGADTPYEAHAPGAPAPAGSAPAAGRTRTRRQRRSRARDAGAAAVGALGSGVLLVARLVMAIATLIALLIALAVVLRDVDANSSNTIVEGIHEGANFFAGAFTGLITFAGHPKRAITVNWGIALLVYLIVGAVIARVIASVGRGGVLFERRHRTLAGG
jgi:hypothetical protein